MLESQLGMMVTRCVARGLSCNIRPRTIARQFRPNPQIFTSVVSFPSLPRASLGLRRHYASAVKRAEDDKREQVVILGSGWAGYVLARSLNKKKYKVLVVSPRSYFVFTPLLNDTAVGTLEFRNALESVRQHGFNADFVQGWADDVNFVGKTILVEPSVLDPNVGHALTGPRPPSKDTDLVAQTAKEKELLEHVIEKKDMIMGGTGKHPVPTFPIKYDKLVIAVGAYSQTFGTPGVRENALFLKDVGDARKIRRRVLELFELANSPITPDTLRNYLLHFVIVGGGPTGMEFAASVSDLIHQDLAKLYPSLIKFVKVTLYDVAPKVLPMFDAELADYAVKQYTRQNVTIKTSHHVEELRKGLPNDKTAQQNQDDQTKGRVYTIRTKEEGDVGVGMCVWSTGNMSNPFIAKALNHVRKYPSASAELTEGGVSNSDDRQWILTRDQKSGALIVDDHFRIQLHTTDRNNFASTEENPRKDASAARAVMQDVFAIGDNAHLQSGALPATAQVANQQARFLSRLLNHSSSRSEFSAQPGFHFRDLGVMTYLGGAKAVLQGPHTERSGEDKSGFNLRGWVAYLTWRGAYLTMTLSWRNKLLIAWQWLVVKFFGRDISRF